MVLAALLGQIKQCLQKFTWYHCVHHAPPHRTVVGPVSLILLVIENVSVESSTFLHIVKKHCRQTILRQTYNHRIIHVAIVFQSNQQLQLVIEHSPPFNSRITTPIQTRRHPNTVYYWCDVATARGVYCGILYNNIFTASED